MIRLLGPIPHYTMGVAVSGGPDSMALLSFLAKRRRYDSQIHAVYFHHGTDFGNECYDFVNSYCKENDIPLVPGYAGKIDPPKGTSPEEHWRNERYAYFEYLLSRNIFDKILLGHHLNDVVETYIFSALHGQPKLIPYSRNEGKIIRPFLLTPHAKLVDWCERHDVPYLLDPANNDDRFARSTIRNDMMPHVFKINPGIEKVIRRKIALEYIEKNDSNATFDFLQS